MKRFISTLLGLTFLTSTAFGAILPVDQAQLGTPKNYISNGGIERGSYGFKTFADAAAATPVDGTGGSPSHITIAASTSSPLSGSRSLNIINAGSTSAQGEGVSYDFAVNSGDEAQVIDVSFDYSLVSGTFVAGAQTGSSITDSDLEIFVYDVTNSTLIQPSGYLLTCGAVVGTKCTQPAVRFQTASNSTSYRLIFYVPTTHTSAWTMKVDNIVASRMIKQFGAPASDSLAYIPTFTGFGTVASSTFSWSRVGDSVIIEGTLVAGTTTATEARITLPSGLTSASDYPTLQVVGAGWTSTTDQTIVPLIEASKTYLTFGKGNSAVAGLAKANGNAWSTAATLSFKAKVRIAGWSSSVQMSDGTDTRVVALSATNSGTSITSSAADITSNWTTVFDTHSAFSSGVYTVQVPGYYLIAASVGVSATAQVTASILINGSIVRSAYSYSAANGSGVPEPVYIANLKAGDTIKIQGTSSSTSNTSGTTTTLQIQRLSGPATIAATETIAARYTSTSGQTFTGTLATITFPTKDFDTHGAVSSGVFTAPAAGKYQVNAALRIATEATGPYNLIILKNASTTVSRVGMQIASGSQIQSIAISDILSLSAGDTLAIQAQTTSGTATLSTTAGDNYFSVQRLGL